MDAYRCSVRRKCVCVSRISPLYERNTGYLLIIVIVQLMYLFKAFKQNVAHGLGLISLYFNFLSIENPNRMNTRYIYLFTHLRLTLIRNCLQENFELVTIIIAYIHFNFGCPINSPLFEINRITRQLLLILGKTISKYNINGLIYFEKL